MVGVTWISSKHFHFQQAPSPSTSTFFLSLCFKLLFQAPTRSTFYLSLCFKLLFQGLSRSTFFLSLCFKLLFQGPSLTILFLGSNKHLLYHISFPSFFLNTFFISHKILFQQSTFFFHFIYFSLLSLFTIWRSSSSWCFVGDDYGFSVQVWCS